MTFVSSARPSSPRDEAAKPTAAAWRSVAALVALLGTAVALGAATPTFWQVATQADLLKGEVDNLSVDSDGRLVLGPRAELVSETTTPVVWALARGPDGTLYAGSGNEGKVFRIDAGGRAAVLFDAAELEVHAVAVAPDGTLYAATSPDGRIYKLDSNGQATPFFDPEDKYIWALLATPDGSVYAATGEKAGIYRITASGQGTLVYRAKASHVLSLALDTKGRVLAGTDSPGQVLRLEEPGRAFVLLDSRYREIRALRLAPDGTLYAAAVSGPSPAEERPPERPPVEAPRPTPVPTVSTEITAIAIGDVGVAAGGQPPPGRREERRLSRGAVYRVAPDGLWDIVWESSGDLPYDVSFDAEGALLIGTGPKGKLYRLVGDPPRSILVGRAPAQQVTKFLPDGRGGNYYATANPGKLFRLTRERATRGTYESEVRDAETVATWGTIRWRAATPPGTAVRLFTRSGNTAIPDETWSPWSAAYTNPEGEPIRSPKARYLQWRAELTGGAETPVLTSVTIAYLPRNLRPQVTSITVHPPGVVFQKPFSTGEPEIAGYEDPTSDGRGVSSAAPPPAGPGQPSSAPALGRRTYQKGLQTFLWKAEDPNGDRIQFDILYRREGETTWQVLRRGLWDPIYVWDTTSVPDGTYTIKIVASDAPSNAPGTALVGELESTAFDVDNSPPRIAVQPPRIEGGRLVVPFTVRDEQSPIARVEFSTDANRWRVLYPKDGIPDSRTEEFELLLEDNPRPTNLVLRATDAMNNTATAAVGLPR